MAARKRARWEEVQLVRSVQDGSESLKRPDIHDQYPRDIVKHVGMKSDIYSSNGINKILHLLGDIEFLLLYTIEEKIILPLPLVMSLAGTLFLQQQWFVGALQLLSYCEQRCQLGGQSMYSYVQVPRLFPQQTSDGFGEGGALVGGGGGNLVVPTITRTTASTTACKVSVSLTTLAFVTRI